METWHPDARPSYPGTVADRLRDWRYERWIHRVLKEKLLPPPPSAFGAFGQGSFIVPPARIDRPDRIFLGRQITIHENGWLAIAEAHSDIVPRLVIGDRSRIGRFCHIACIGSIEIGSDVLISDRVLICDAYHGYEDVNLRAQDQPMSRPRPVVIGDGACVAIGAIILPGVRIGERAYVSDWSVVTRTVPPGTIVGGNPAVVQERLPLGPREPVAAP